MMRRHSKYKASSFNYKFSTIFLVLFIFLQFLNKSHVMCGENLFFPNLSINPDEYQNLPSLPLRSSNQNQHFPKSEPREISDANENENGPTATTEKVDTHKRFDTFGNSLDHVNPELIYKNGGHKKPQFYYAEDGQRNPKNQQDGAYGRQQQVQKLLPMGFLFSRQLVESSNPKIFNQANGLIMDKEPSEEEEAESNSRLALFNSFNEFDLPPKQMATRSRPSHFILGELHSKRSQSVAGREGYMCHFKLCQLGASGKRRWSPVFEYD